MTYSLEGFCHGCGSKLGEQHKAHCSPPNFPKIPVKVNKNEGSTVDKTLEERGARYGDFSDHAKIAQDLQDVMRRSVVNIDGGIIGVNPAPAWNNLSQVQKQALTVIADKIARILSGDPNYADNWHDIQGYAKLVEDRLPRECGHPKSPLAECGECTVLSAFPEEPALKPMTAEKTCCKHGTLYTKKCSHCKDGYQ